MKASPVSRLLAVILIVIPIAWYMSHQAQRHLDQIRLDPAGYLQHQRSIQHPSFVYQFFGFFIILGGLTFIVEGLAQLIGRFLPEKSGQAAELTAGERAQ